MRTILSAYHLQDCDQADRNLQSMAGEPHERLQLAEILPTLMEAVARTANPDQALTHWDRLLEGIARSSLFAYVGRSPRILNLLCTIFGNSDALAFTVIRDPMLVYWLAEEGVLTKVPTRKGMEEAARKAVGRMRRKDMKLEALRRVRRREMLRIGVRDLLHVADVPETTAALSDLAGALIHAAYKIVDADLRKHYGVPMHKNGQGEWTKTGFAVIGMGKLGGHELNYSSDVDLIYVYASDAGETRPPKVGGRTQPGAVGTSNEEYFEILSRDLTKALAEHTQEGHIFRVDLRLRAEGTVGQLARSLDDYTKYYDTRGAVWERLALLKAWPVAGSREVGKTFVKMVRPFVLGRSEEQVDFVHALGIVRDVRDVKDRIDTKIAGRRQERRNVKLGIGGIREIEFLVQTIQVIAGNRLAGLIDRNTIGSLNRCVHYKLISKQKRDELTNAYLFLRDVEHKLQMVDDLQTHTLPESGEELERCAIRAGYGMNEHAHPAERFRADHQRHTETVNQCFRSLFNEPESSPLLQAILTARPS
ncbi:MAG: hypothetical protein OEY86_18400 [Nitrospira sp.]|nr:hypothetical protein [Nitrospira sp.]